MAIPPLSLSIWNYFYPQLHKSPLCHALGAIQLNSNIVLTGQIQLYTKELFTLMDIPEMQHTKSENKKTTLLKKKPRGP